MSVSYKVVGVSSPQVNTAPNLVLDLPRVIRWALLWRTCGQPTPFRQPDSVYFSAQKKKLLDGMIPLPELCDL